MTEKFISWNVNGLRAGMGKGFKHFFDETDADIFALQETKLQEGQIDFAPEGYMGFWNYAEKKGYSGTAVFTKKEPLSVAYGMGADEKFETEGRVITLEFPDYYFVTVYTPNAQRELTRLAFRCEWEDAFRAYLIGLDKKKPVIVCGDMNVAHNEIDLKTRRATAAMQDSPMKKDRNSPCCLKAALRTVSVCFIPTGRMPTHGGAICSKHVSGTPAGA